MPLYEGGVRVDGGIKVPDGGVVPGDDSGLPGDDGGIVPPPPPGPMENIHFLGRFDRTDPGGPRFSWPGTALAARVQGTRIDLNLKSSGSDQLAVVIDGKTPKIIKTSGATSTYVLATGLAGGEHDVTIVKRTEASVGTLQLLGFVQTVVPTPNPFVRKIELVGDSITCGYGIDAKAGCDLAVGENAYLAYGPVTARKFSADYALVSWSGKGMYRNFGGETTETIPKLYDRALAAQTTSKWDFTAWIPDVVVINLGTNDYAGGDPGKPFADAYTAFVTRVRGNYPNAQILCTLGPMLTGNDLSSARTAIQGVVSGFTAMGDTRVTFLEYPTQSASDGNGCDGHPSDITHQKMAALLEKTISGLTGW